MRAKVKKNICFEAALKQLEQIVKELEDGNLSLDESLASFASGIELSMQCMARLEAAEQEIDLILSEEQSKIIEKPLKFQEVEG